MQIIKKLSRAGHAYSLGSLIPMRVDSHSVSGPIDSLPTTDTSGTLVSVLYPGEAQWCA